MHPSKRKSKESAAAALTKPFRSPLPVDPSKNNKSSSEKQEIQDTRKADGLASRKIFSNRQTCISSPLITTPTSSPGSIRFRHTRPLPTKSFPSLSHNDDPEYSDLLRQYSSLLAQQQDLTASLDITLQAFQIKQLSKDKDLAGLIKKWRSASREAAEELFSTAKDRVNNMGGVGVWRDMCTKPREILPWNDEPEVGENNLTEEQKEQLEIERDEARIERQKYGLGQAELPATVEARDDENDVSKEDGYCCLASDKCSYWRSILSIYST